MNRIKGTLLIAGVAAAFAVSVACSSGESSSTPGTQPAPIVPAARIEPQMPVEPVLVAPPASNQPLTQNQPVSLPPVISGPTVEIPSATAPAISSPAILHGTPRVNLTYEGAVYYSKALSDDDIANLDENDLELVGATTESNLLLPGSGESLNIYKLKNGEEGYLYTLEPGRSFLNEDGTTITIAADWTRWAAAFSSRVGEKQDPIEVEPVSEQAQGPPGLSGEMIERLASRLPVMTLAVAVAREGRGPFDNFLPCVRRGVINYYNTDAGRYATFSDCDLGDGVSVHGAGELKWVGPELSTDRRTISRIIWDGELTAVIRGETEVQINEMEIDAIEMQIDFKRNFPDRLQLGSLTATLLGETIKVDDETLLSQLFDTSAMDINSIPNPSESLSALTESDMRRLAYDEATFLALVLLDELQESQRGNHIHEYPCGTSVITQNLEDKTTRIDYTWNNCDLNSSGLFMDGIFSAELNFDEKLGHLAIVIEGDLTIGGGIPKITIRRLEWSLEGTNSLQGQVLISGKIEGEVDKRSFSFDLILDD